MRNIEDELFELIFEGLDEPTAVRLFGGLVGSEVQVPTEHEGLVEVVIDVLPLRPGVVLRDVHVRLFRYKENVCDVETNFKLRHAEAPSRGSIVAALQEFAMSHAKANGIERYFAGLEPATDKDTRLFTRSEEGPWYHL